MPHPVPRLVEPVIFAAPAVLPGSAHPHITTARRRAVNTSWPHGGFDAALASRTITAHLAGEQVMVYPSAVLTPR